jgi:multiple sugar transport system ATP-binding protein
MAGIVLDRVHKRYPNGFVAAHDLSLEIVDGELLVLVGPSGSGKSTVLRMIAGLESVTSGRILIDGVDVTALPPQERDLAMVFQSYALYPHMTVRDNLAFGLSVRGTPSLDIETRINAAAESLGISRLLMRKPAQLSGGQRQRVALGRAIVREPRAFLFDEPLSNLDASLRVETRTELARLHQRLGATMVYVTHDQVEAMTLGTRVAVMRAGEIQQVGPPMSLYREPANQFVAGFVGSPQMNFVPGRLEVRDGAVRFEGSGLTLALDALGGTIGGGKDVIGGIRPQDLAVASVGSGAPNDLAWTARVRLVEPLGSEQIVHLSAGALDDLVVVVPPDRELQRDAAVNLRVTGPVHLFDVETGRRLV